MQKFWLMIILLLLLQNQCVMRNRSATSKREGQYYRFIKSCLHPISNLAQRAEGERFTTPYANALAAMAFIHEQDYAFAVNIFRPFDRYYRSHHDHFDGLPQLWNVETALPDSSSINWEGDAAFLVLALNYLKHANNNEWPYQALLTGLLQWLQNRTRCSNIIVAEGIADMAAALALVQQDLHIQYQLAQLRQCFFSEGLICSRDYQHNLSHIIRGALVFNDSTGFRFYKTFVRSQVRGHDMAVSINACSAYADDPIINVEISAQLTLALQYQNQHSILTELNLPDEIEKLTVPSRRNPELIGIPSLVPPRSGSQSRSLPALEPTCFMLFYYWGFNPYLAGKNF